MIETHLQKADLIVRAPLRGIFDDYRDLFPSKLPYGCGDLGSGLVHYNASTLAQYLVYYSTYST